MTNDLWQQPQVRIKHRIYHPSRDHPRAGWLRFDLARPSHAVVNVLVQCRLLRNEPECAMLRVSVRLFPTPRCYIAGRQRFVEQFELEYRERLAAVRVGITKRFRALSHDEENWALVGDQNTRKRNRYEKRFQQRKAEPRRPSVTSYAAGGLASSSLPKRTYPCFWSQFTAFRVASST